MSPDIQDTRQLYSRVLKEITDEKEQISALLRIYYDLVLALSESSMLHFNTLFARVSYLISLYQLSKAWAYALQIPRRELHERTISDAQLFPILTSVIDCLLLLRSCTQPDDLDHKKLPPLPALPSQTRTGKKLEESFRVAAIAWDKEKKLFDAVREAEPDMIYTVHYSVAGINDLFAENVEDAFTLLGLPVILGLTEIRSPEPGHLVPGYILVLPDLLMDVTAVAEYLAVPGKPPSINLLPTLKPPSVTTALLTGKVANFFLDQLLHDPDAGFDALLQQVFRLYPFEFVRMADDELRDYLPVLKIHYENIREVIVHRFPGLGIQSNRCVIEPSYFSPVFGIKGRLDMYYKDPSSRAASIIELKSSRPFKPNAYGLSQSHYHQTLLYELLVQSAHVSEPHRRNYILYSVMGEEPLRFAASVASIQKEAIQNRNQLTLLQFMMSRLDYPEARDLLMDIDPSHYNELKGFMVTDIVQFNGLYQSLNEHEQHYFKSFIAFITREHLVARIGRESAETTGGLAGLWLHSLQEKEERYQVLQGLTLDEILHHDGQMLLIFHRTEKTNPLANFRAGDIAILYPAHASAPHDPTRFQLHRGSILETNPSSVTVRLRNDQVMLDELKGIAEWNIEQDMLDSSFRSLYQSMHQWMSADTVQRNLLLGLKKPGTLPWQGEPEAPSYLTPHQQAIYIEGLRAASIYLLWGPPGTGKTSYLLKSWVEYYFHHSEKRILLLAYTNRAVDEICETLSSCEQSIRQNYIRIGSRAGTGEQYRSRLLDEAIQPLQKRSDIHSLLSTTRIFTGTIAAVQGRHDLFELIRFDLAIVDEASQLLEPAIIGLMTRTKKTILIGDHMQLPAIAAQPEGVNRLPKDKPWANEIGMSDLRMSYFERMYRRYTAHGWHHVTGTLLEQGRMHADIMAFPNEYVYHQRLSCIDAKQQHISLNACFPDLQHDLLAGRMIFIPSESMPSEIYSKTNSNEAQVVIRLISIWRKLLAHAGMNWTIGVITPFRAQIAAIHYLAHHQGVSLEGITVDTVERYQGGARDIIIMSAAVNHKGLLSRISSLTEEGIDRKLNVAVTRARQQFILTGIPEVLETAVAYQKLLSCCLKLDSASCDWLKEVVHHPVA